VLITILAGAVAGGTSILWAALGETISERAGVINVGTEGTMLLGALVGFAMTVETGSVWAGVVAAAAAGALLALVFAIVTVLRGGNQLASGLALTFLALGLTSLYGADYVGVDVHGFETVEVPLLAELPVAGKVVFQQDPLVYLGFLAVPAVWWLLFRSRWGLLIRTAGERPDALSAYGVSPARVRMAAVVVGGALAGVGGAQLSTAVAESWSEGMTAGRGFIAVALVVFGARRPLRVMGGAYLFGAALTLGSVLQVHGVKINQFALDALPYVLTLVVLVILMRRSSDHPPEALGQPL
jgi:general nucleoside transport system permease protein